MRSRKTPDATDPYAMVLAQVQRVVADQPRSTSTLEGLAPSFRMHRLQKGYAMTRTVNAEQEREATGKGPIACPRCGKLLRVSDPIRLAHHHASVFCQAHGDTQKAGQRRAAKLLERRARAIRLRLLTQISRMLAKKDEKVIEVMIGLKGPQRQRALTRASSGFLADAERLLVEVERDLGPSADARVLRSTAIMRIRMRKERRGTPEPNGL
jgi:hypothetical protein